MRTYGHPTSGRMQRSWIICPNVPNLGGQYPHTWGTTAEAVPTYSQNLGSFLRRFLWLAALEAPAILTVMACSGPAAPRHWHNCRQPGGQCLQEPPGVWTIIRTPWSLSATKIRSFLNTTSSYLTLKKQRVPHPQWFKTTSKVPPSPFQEVFKQYTPTITSRTSWPQPAPQPPEVWGWSHFQSCVRSPAINKQASQPQSYFGEHLLPSQPLLATAITDPKMRLLPPTPLLCLFGWGEAHSAVGVVSALQTVTNTSEGTATQTVPRAPPLTVLSHRTYQLTTSPYKHLVLTEAASSLAFQHYCSVGVFLTDLPTSYSHSLDSTSFYVRATLLMYTYGAAHKTGFTTNSSPQKFLLPSRKFTTCEQKCP